MIAVDTSALMAIVLGEPQADACIAALAAENEVLISAAARRTAAAYTRWGKGAHAAGLNFGDCFAYEVAKEHACPLLYVGADLAQTDVMSAL